ncbi:hypothetical protein BWQ96_05240 [Gracilariopsis chorda]|uniref:VWFA domain-containing protein n=1 Tax=Gracilariopsis chorda TaxID=448386 RepID=A0A2V3IS99_9FLOR|nr:hypothetical protein BWQ96_05240 [Gracilariopsis chorda]|eukprot:PXF44993.1 hypothetical protein BWQ96_05240 [Gracilariopsis chorda]
MARSRSSFQVCFFFIVFLLCFYGSEAQADVNNPEVQQLLEARTQVLLDTNQVAKRIGRTSVFNLQREVLVRGFCNRPLCFALDGSASIPAADFEFQRGLISLLASFAAIDTESEFSAVQYGLATTGISLPTSNITLFLQRVSLSRQVNASRTFISAGLASCLRQVRRGNETSGIIVVLGDGRANFATDSLDQVLQEVDDELVVSVGVGTFLNPNLLKKLSRWVPERVFLFDSYSDINAKAVSALLSRICWFKPLVNDSTSYAQHEPETKGPRLHAAI